MKRKFITAATWDQYVRQCRGKVPFASELSAEKQRVFCEGYYGGEWSKYECPFCGKWHTGHNRRLNFAVQPLKDAAKNNI